MTHTLPPFHVGHTLLKGQVPIYCEESAGKFVAICGATNDMPAEANAEFIVRACNGHAALVETLQRIIAGERGPDGGVGADLNQAYHAQRIALAVLKLTGEA